MNIQEKMHTGALYPANLSVMGRELTELFYKNRDLIYDFNHTRQREEKRRNAILQELFAELGEDCYIEAPFYANWGSNTHFGDGVYANFGLTLVDDTDIYVGDHVMIGPNVVIATAAHPACPALRWDGYQYNKAVTIEKNVWIGAGAVLLPGITVGENSIIGAGSIVTHDIPANVVAVGNPCKVLRPITEEDDRFYDKTRPIDTALLAE